MIGVPMADPRQAVIADLSKQIDAFYRSGKKTQLIPNGVSAKAPFFGTNAHQVKLRAQRDKLAAAVRAEAEKGITANEAAKNLKMHIKRVTLIAQENGFRFADNP